ncbi:CDP-diacylglycerol--serine O-phosphatidyltransferase [Rhizobium sp. RM]|uniref:CDP-diacylglycerol--serine O-phosphatidyltransferase n=1 Tax=Rhizobium/Agrobacterium group TaxID=227290 RepID=UPI00110D688A|nr:MULTISPECIES: CDP-diacylglycerol--serine O-phosphatidyltransferase [Rhizobium/Agrobacterium group]NWJ22719.1 CDP-diacylglycerol--serine O-phosphatidyltransferase [Rhizobium sp. RM]TMV12373.1 CDP-diacylglycerol--serine O-phosphatidyltransferase [Rhizobium sp. Td3]UXS00663.1 CDP-diacylglycerol--serine O-phosphatidyltransferase [Agrobacterium tumefaciens]
METPASQPLQNEKHDARNDSGRGPRLREIPLRLVVPNLITVLAICAGLSGVRLAFEGRFELAVGMVLLAAFLDGIDGRIARMMKATSKFGEQMDSLADIVNFGVAPALVVYAYLLDQARSFGWIAALIYVIAAGLRLARFNVMIERAVKAPWQAEFFVGVPAPMGAMLVLLPVYLGFLGVEPDKTFAYIAAAYTVLIGYFLISRLPVWSGKASRIRRDLVLPMILVVVLYVAMLMSFTWEVLVLTVAAYLVFIPFSARLWHRRYGTLTIEEDGHSEADGGDGLDRGI